MDVYGNEFEKELDVGWKIAIDSNNTGKNDGWMSTISTDAVQAIFPGYIEDSISSFRRGVAWYWNEFTVDSAIDDAYEYFIKTGYSEWLAEYWLNGEYVGSFTGLRLNYEFNITKMIKPGKNLIAVRVISPSSEPIDGWKFGGEIPGVEKTYSNGNIVTSARNANLHYGGILYPVHIACRYKVRTGRIVIKSDMRNGSFLIKSEMINHTLIAQNAKLSIRILSESGETAWSLEKTVSIAEGESEIECKGIIHEHKLWDIESPYLYFALINLSVGNNIVNSSSVRFGFRDFRVKNGFFYLNDKRLFLKCSNTVPDLPVWANKPWDRQCVRNEMIREKAMGHNAIRFLCSNAWPEVLDLCDEIGLMVYQEHAASWTMDEGNPYFEEQFDFHVRGVLHRDINHPCFTMFGLINESHCKRERNCAMNELKLLRQEDDSRLIILGSGRWDAQYRVGSVSNPGSYEWECVWGAEDPDAPEYPWPEMSPYGRKDLVEYGGEWGCREDELTCWTPEQGDTHIYPRIPMTQRSVSILRTHSAERKPAFISEGSHNSMGNPFQTLRKAEEAGNVKLADSYWMQRIWEDNFKRDFFRFGLDELYGVPEDIVKASYPLNAKQRRLYFDCVRSNPQIAGFCYTMAIDLSGAGTISFERDKYKPYMCDMISDCFAPLHWCIFVNPTHVYRGRPFTVEAVLANEDVLNPGRYPVSASVVSKEYGKIWEYRTELIIPENNGSGCMPLSFQAFKETVIIDKPEGEYTLSVYLENGGCPTGGVTAIYVSEAESLKDVSASLIGIADSLKLWLNEKGVKEDASSGLVLVGEMPDNDDSWEELYDKVKNGASAVFLLPETLIKDVRDPFDYKEYVPDRLPFENKGKLTYADNWHYHTYGAVKAHPYTKGLYKGLMDDEYYMLSTPQFVFFDQDVPDEVAAVSIALPYYTHSTEGTPGYLFGTTLGVYKYGRGRLTLNCFKLFDQYGNSPSHNNLNHNPAADRLLLNIIMRENEILHTK